MLRRFSTLDICPLDSFKLILIHSASRTGRGEQILSLLREHIPSIPVKSNYFEVNFKLPFAQRAHEWLNGFGLGPQQLGSVLVQPDQHILHVLRESIAPRRL